MWCKQSLLDYAYNNYLISLTFFQSSTYLWQSREDRLDVLGPNGISRQPPPSAGETTEATHQVGKKSNIGSWTWRCLFSMFCLRKHNADIPKMTSQIWNEIFRSTCKHTTPLHIAPRPSRKKRNDVAFQSYNVLCQERGRLPTPYFGLNKSCLNWHWRMLHTCAW